MQDFSSLGIELLKHGYRRFVTRHLFCSAHGLLRINHEVLDALAWIIHQGSSQKRKDALKGMMNTGFADPAFPFGASIT